MLSSLPQVLSGEQVRCALHISKRKCAWMLNNGFIKCQNTGYTDNTINRWLGQGHLKSVQTQTTKIISKVWLIDFYCSYGYTITNMSDKHIKLLQKFFKENK